MDRKTSICKNPWCKATFYYENEIIPNTCKKCDSFDRELSGGITWEDRTYDGPRIDGKPHTIKIDVKKYFK